MRLTPKDISALELNQLRVKSVDDNAVVFVSEGDDPYITISDIKLTPVGSSSPIYPIVAALSVVLVIYRFVRLGSILASLKSLYSERRLIASLAVNDFKTRFAGSYFGIVWAYVQPICTILVFWFVFQVGFRNPDVGNVEYILWFMTGLIPWFFFSEAWNSATNAFMEYSYLVKKVVFKINILPIIKILSALFVHLFFIVFMMFVYVLYGRFPTVYYLQIIYYMFCMVVLVTALSFVTAPLIIFFRDLGQIMNIVLQFGMWLTPIMWSVDNLPSGMGIFVNIFKLNPMYYIVQGYRNSMIYNVMFYDNILQTVYFWCVILVLALVGGVIYKRLKPHFADVL
jgi:teichoic acid transport system permease protein